MKFFFFKGLTFSHLFMSEVINRVVKSLSQSVGGGRLAPSHLAVPSSGPSTWGVGMIFLVTRRVPGWASLLTASTGLPSCGKS